MEVIQLQESFTLKAKDNLWKPFKKQKILFEEYGIILGKTIAEGENSKIKKALSKKLGETVAVKIIKKSKIEPDIFNKFVWREIGISQCLEHESLLDIFHVLEDSHYVYIVMEFAPNGSLLEIINKTGCLDESDARRLFNQLLNVVAYLHSKCVCHRDIKCDNILLDHEYNIKLADFGFVRLMSNNGMCETACGSYVYAAPEVLEGGSYSGIKADIWSMGICLYAMLCGCLPYQDLDISTLKLSMMEKLKFYKHVSKDCKQLLKSILTIQPSARPDIKAIKKHTWMCKALRPPGQSSLSSLSVAAVLSHHNTAGYAVDPYSEHGFTCDQLNSSYKTTRVTDLLRCVADNHSSGTSSVDLTRVQIPVRGSSNVAMMTGVAGPIGRRLSQVMEINTDTNEKMQGNRFLVTGTTHIRQKTEGKQAFGRAFKALQKFRVAAKVVTAIQRFNRKPLNTILNMPQEQAMEKMVLKREDAVKHETKNLNYSFSGKMASKLGNEKKKALENKRCEEEIQRKGDYENSEKRRLLQETFFHLLPTEEMHV